MFFHFPWNQELFLAANTLVGVALSKGGAVAWIWKKPLHRYAPAPGVLEPLANACTQPGTGNPTHSQVLASNEQALRGLGNASTSKQGACLS